MTEVSPEKDAKTGRFLTGNSGGGRKKGSRNALVSGLIDALNADFDEHGVEAVRRVREKQPETYLRIIAALVPAKLESTLDVTHHLSEEFQQAVNYADAWKVVRQARELIGAEPLPIIDLEPSDG